MAQRGKRKASGSASTSSRTPRKKINLNGSAPARTSIPSRSRKSISEKKKFQTQEGVIDTTRGSLQKQQRSSSGISSRSNLSLATAGSRFSSSISSFRPTLKSWGSAVQSVNISDWLRRPFAGQNRKATTKMKGIKTKKVDIKGKAKAIEAEDNDGHLSADESARMIQLLDGTPASLNSWQKVNGSASGDVDEDSDAQSGYSVENILRGDDPEVTKDTLSDPGESKELDEDVVSLGNNVEVIKIHEQDPNSTEEVSMSIKGDAIDNDDSLVDANESSDIATMERNTILLNGDRSSKEDIGEESVQREDQENRLLPTESHQNGTRQKEKDETNGEQALDTRLEVQRKQAENGGDAEGDGSTDDEQEESILIPMAGTRDVIDLTESVSPEDEVFAKNDVEPQTSTVSQIPRQASSGFFSSGVLAKEKQVGDQSATWIIQQLGSRQMSASSSSVKVINKGPNGFRKKEPIFSRSRKSLAKEITNSKMNDMLTSLRRRARIVLQAPHLDDMLRKKVLLNKALGDDTPEEEVQIKHLREILARSKSSLRPARRHLKEQERLALEAKLLQKRALGIMGRQPLPRALSSEREDFVRQTFHKQGKIAQMVGAAVENRDIVKLKPGVWLNDEVINFYMKMILKRSDEAIIKRSDARAAKKRLALNEYASPEESKADAALVKEMNKIWNGIWNCWTFTSFFYTKLESGGFSGVRQWTRKVDIFTKDLILLPINISSTHWVCAAINMRKCRFEYYDSMRSRPRGVFEQLKKYLQSEYDDKKKQSAGPLLLDGWGCYVSQHSPLQENAFDCGVFACQTLEQLSRRSPRDYELKDDLNVEKIVAKSRELSEAKHRGDGSSSDGSEEGDLIAAAAKEEDEEEEWNFAQSNIPYLRQRMVFEIANAALLNE